MRYFIIILVIISTDSFLRSQPFAVRGSVSTTAGPVKYAVVTFYDNGDSTKRFSALTDTVGRYSLDIVTSVKSHDNLPLKFELEQNYPNPFISSTSIPYALAEQSDISIKIYNILGQMVREFKLGTQYSGAHSVVWDGNDNLGRRVTPGVYFYELIAANKIQAQKMLFGWAGGNGQIVLNKPDLNRTASSSAESHISSGKVGTIASSIRGYCVRITNTDSTQPLILCTRFDCALAQRDTALNFDVNNFDLSLCYSKGDSMKQPDGEYYYPVWQIHVNNIQGTNSKNITNWMLDCNNPMWSPDGKYIAYTRWKSVAAGSLIVDDADLFLYDVYADSLIAFLASDTSSDAEPIWTFDSKKIIYAHYSHVTGHGGTYIIDLDGKNNRPLKYPVSYLYPDNYNTLYYGTDSMRGQTICHSNLDGTTNELIVDLGPLVATPTGGVNVWDFDPIGNFLLLAFDDPSTALPNSIAKYDITQRRLDTIAVSDTGWKYYTPKF